MAATSASGQLELYAIFTKRLDWRSNCSRQAPPSSHCPATDIRITATVRGVHSAASCAALQGGVCAAAAQTTSAPTKLPAEAQLWRCLVQMTLWLFSLVQRTPVPCCRGGSCPAGALLLGAVWCTATGSLPPRGSNDTSYLMRGVPTGPAPDTRLTQRRPWSHPTAPRELAIDEIRAAHITSCSMHVWMCVSTLVSCPDQPPPGLTCVGTGLKVT